MTTRRAQAGKFSDRRWGRSADRWQLELQIGLLEVGDAAFDAYMAYPEEADAYQTQDLVKASIKERRP